MKNTLPRTLAAALAALAFACTTTLAEDAKAEPKDKGPSKADLKKYDANKDGQLDEAELAVLKADKEAKREGAKKARLEKYDADKDGKMSKAERDAAKADKKAEKEAKKAEHEAKKADKQH